DFSAYPSGRHHVRGDFLEESPGKREPDGVGLFIRRGEDPPRLAGHSMKEGRDGMEQPRNPPTQRVSKGSPTVDHVASSTEVTDRNSFKFVSPNQGVEHILITHEVGGPSSQRHRLGRRVACVLQERLPPPQQWDVRWGDTKDTSVQGHRKRPPL